MTEMQHLLLLLQVRLHPLLPRRRHLRLQRHRLRPRLLVKVSFRSFFRSSSSFSILSGRSAASVWCLCVCEPVSLRFCCVYLCASGPGILVPRRHAFRLGVTKKRVHLARARSLRLSKSKQKKRGDPERPRPSSSITSHDSDLAIAIWISPPFRHTLSFSALELLLESTFAASRNAAGIGIILPFSDAITTTPPPTKSIPNITSKQTCPSTRPFLRYQDFHFFQDE
jgi:hypothetical protein